MARARIRPRGGFSQYTFANPQAELDQAGARSLDETYRDTLAQEQHAASQHYQMLHHELEVAKLKRELAQDDAKVQRRIKYETMMEKAVPELYAIDPADPQAVQKRAAFAARWPQLFHKENDVPGITSEFDQHNRLSSEAERQRNEIQAKKEAADQRAADKTEAARIAAEERKARDKEHQDFMRELHPPKVGPSDAIKERYLKSSKNADDLNKRLELNKGFIDELEARDVNGSKSPLKDEEVTRLEKLKRSRETIQNDYNRELGRKEALELVHPELSPDYVAKSEDAAGATKAPVTPLSPVAVDTATPPPATAEAPLARGTATPSGEMDTSGSTNGTQQPVTPAASAAPSAAAAAPTPHPADPEWDSITAQMQTANGNAEAARARRLTAMDVIAKARPTDYLNPFDKTIENAQKEIEEASKIADQHDATYKELFDKRGALIQKGAPTSPTPVVAVTPPAAVAPVIPNVGVSALGGGIAGGAAAPTEQHPMEGKRVKHKETGQGGTIVNGVFVPDETEALADQEAS